MQGYTAILAVKNGSKFIENALKSILSQTVPPTFVIVSDDGSTDNTRNIINSKFKEVRLICNKPAGQSNAINIALERTETEFVSFIDHDDTWSLNKSEIQLELLKKIPKIEAVYGLVNNIITTEPKKSEVIGPARAFGASMFKRSCFDKVGPLRTDNMHQAVIDWWSRATKNEIKTVGHNDIVLHRLIHGQNIGILGKLDSTKNLLMRVREHHMRVNTKDKNG
jgi:glycosyltransferase involved in cell wall biosynthesis